MILGVLLLAKPVQAWQELRGDHFIVFYESDEPFARESLRYAEKYYTKIADDLGYSRYSNFWQWENRAKIYIYPSAEAYRKSTGEPEWSHGVAIYSKKEIHSFSKSEGFLEGILPHEVTHLIFRDFIGFTARAPVWLDEGVAQWEEPKKRELAKQVARWLIHNDKDMPVQDLTRTDPKALEDEEAVHFFYMQSVSLVDYLIRNFGASRFTDFCRALRDGKRLEDALNSSFKIENQWELQEKWKAEIMGGPQTEELEIYFKK